MKFSIALLLTSIGALLVVPARAQNQNRQRSNLFNKWDTSGDGQVSRDEFAAGLNAD